MRVLQASEELERFLNKRARAFFSAFNTLARAELGEGDYSRALWALSERMRETLILSDLLGRRRGLLEARAVAKARFAVSPLPAIPFEEAIQDIVEREPRLARDFRQVSELYSQENVFAMARSSSAKLTQRVQQAIAEAARTGKGVGDVEATMREIGDWTQSYSANVYRTNVSSSYNRGRMQIAQDPDVQEIVPALMYVAQRDERTRPNHAAAHGLIASTDDAIWTRFRPPLGYQCRCAVEFVSVFELEDRGMIRNGQVVPRFPPSFRAAGPDPGFRTQGLNQVG